MSNSKKAHQKSSTVEIRVLGSKSVCEDTQKKDKKQLEMEISSSDVDSEDDSFSKNMIKIKLNVRGF
jgi:hypothetical protein